MEEALALLGGTTLDVHLNDVAYWANVPEKVWLYSIGGYQVLKKWLSYWEQKLLGRALSLDDPDEVRNFTAIVARIGALLPLGDRLDENYRAEVGRGSTSVDTVAKERGARLTRKPASEPERSASSASGCRDCHSS